MIALHWKIFFMNMKGLFVELPAFERERENYFREESYQAFQRELLQNPEKGDLIQGTGGLRKIRVNDPYRGKGKCGGARVIYYWQIKQSHFLLFTVYGKDIQDDLTSAQRAALARLLQTLIGENK